MRLIISPARKRLGRLVLPVLTLLPGFTAWAGIGSAFTYQGRLAEGENVANGIYDLRFSLRDAATGGTQVGVSVTNTGVVISNGFFAATLDFGASAVDGNPRWLEISVRQDTNDFTVLSPRQPVTPAPYAIMAANLGANGLAAVTNASWIAATNVVTAATNDLNTALVARIVTATNAPWIASTSFVVAALSSLNTTLVARVVAATNALWITTTNWVLAQGYQSYLTTNGLTRKPMNTPTPSNGTNYVVDFANEVVQLAATNHITLFQSTNLPAAGWYGECVWYIQGGATNWALRLNPNWIGVGTLAATPAPYVLSSNKLTIVALSARGGSETNVVYAISGQE